MGDPTDDLANVWRWFGEHQFRGYSPIYQRIADVGASAGINLLCDHYRLEYGHHGATGPADSTVRVSCQVTGGDPPIADRLPAFTERVGIDLSPIDLTDPADARWLLACVWPDTGRAERVEASIRLAQQERPTVIAGRANAVIPGVLACLPAGATAIVTTTSAFGYFPKDERTEFVEQLRAESWRRHIAWVSTEGVSTIDALADLEAGDSSGDVLGALLFTTGIGTARLLAHVHPHGNSFDWRASS